MIHSQKNLSNLKNNLILHFNNQINKTNMKKILVVAIALIASVSMTSCSNTSANSNANPTANNESNVDSTVSVNVNEFGKTWEYTSTSNDMGEKTDMAYVLAKDLVEFEFPYNGGSQGKITLRNKNGQYTAMFLIDKGQIQTDYDGTYIRVKFDDEAPVKWSMAESSDNSSDVLFFNNEKKFLDKLRKSKKVVLEIPFYQSGNEQFVFNTSDLKF
jgi:hypothetical protein